MIVMWQYCVESSFWSVGGLVIGYMLGYVGRDIRMIKKRIEHDK